MSDLEVRIVKLEPMRVAAALGFGPSPEDEAWGRILAYAKANNLVTEPDDGARFYGFNNPDPSPGSPNYGYEQWLVVDGSMKGTEEIEIKNFEGGLYAVTRCDSLEVIGETWQALVAWREDSPHRRGHHQWLENQLNSPTNSIGSPFFDLYLPIVE